MQAQDRAHRIGQKKEVQVFRFCTEVCNFKLYFSVKLFIHYVCVTVLVSHCIMVMVQYTIEEKVIERAYKKLALDALVIQQGRLAEQKSKHLLDDFSCFFAAWCMDCLIWFRWLICAAVNKDELLQMVRFGAEMVFSSKDSTITDEDIDRIIAKGEEATAELDAKMKKFTEDAIKFKMDDSM